MEEKLDRLCQGSETLEGEQAERPSPDISPPLLGPIMNDQSHGQPTPLGPGPTGIQSSPENWHQPQERAQLQKKLMLQVILAIKAHVQLNGFISCYLGGLAILG